MTKRQTGEGKRSTDFAIERVRKMAARRNLQLTGDQGRYWLTQNGRTILSNTTLQRIETHLLSIPITSA
jgi:hypothetical protein